jgi:acyl carrier protein
MEQLIVILNEVRPNKDYAGATNFFDQGMLDSLDMTALVAALESHYSIFLDIDDIVAENLCSIAAIQKLLERKGVAA